MNLDWLRKQLRAWGARNRARGIGYPTMSATEKARVGRGGAFCEAPLPQDLEEIDHAVCRLEPQHKLIIAEIYTHQGTNSDHMIRLCLSEHAYYRRKNLAEKRVYRSLTTRSENVRSMHC